MSVTIRLCMGCMNPTGDNNVCASCGYSDNVVYNPRHISPGTILINRYIVGRVISFNGEGTTYIAYDKFKNEKIFIKEFMPDTLCERVIGSVMISVKTASIVQYKSYISEFMDLNRKLAKMKSISSINSATEIFEANNTAYVVLEYIDGITLKHLLQDNAGELTWEQVIKIFPPIFTTLSLVHNAGIIHRGISLDTIYYTNKGELKLTAFAVAATRTVNTDLKTYLFTGFAAPEQYSVRKWQGTWTDVYAISALLYRILTGCMPIDSNERISDDRLLPPCEINPNIPKNVSRVIIEGMELDAENRIQTITELVTRLFSEPDEKPADMMKKPASSRVETVINISKPVAKSVAEKPAQIKNKPTPTRKKSKLLASFLNFENARMTLMVGSAILVSVLIVIFVVINLLFGSDDSNPTIKQGTYTSSFASEPDFSVDDSSENVTVDTTTEATDQTDSFVSAVPTLPMPNLVDGTLQGVQSNEELKKWIVIVAEYEYIDNYPKGIIFYQDVPADTEIVTGQIINVKVSKGTANAIVPDYTGQKYKDYLILLDSLNIKYDTEFENSSNVMTDYIIRTSKQVGDKINLVENEMLIVYISGNGF